MTAEVFGYCIVGQQDEPLGPDKLCQEHRMVGIPPSYGRRTQEWIDGTWEPFIARPDNYVYRPRFPDVPSAAAEPVTVVCACGKTFSYLPNGGSAPRYCSTVCKGKAARARRKAGAA